MAQVQKVSPAVRYVAEERPGNAVEAIGTPTLEMVGRAGEEVLATSERSVSHWCQSNDCSPQALVVESQSMVDHSWRGHLQMEVSPVLMWD